LKLRDFVPTNTLVGNRARKKRWGPGPGRAGGKVRGGTHFPPPPTRPDGVACVPAGGPHHPRIWPCTGSFSKIKGGTLQGTQNPQGGTTGTTVVTSRLYPETGPRRFGSAGMGIGPGGRPLGPREESRAAGFLTKTGRGPRGGQPSPALGGPRGPPRHPFTVAGRQAVKKGPGGGGPAGDVKTRQSWEKGPGPAPGRGGAFKLLARNSGPIPQGPAFWWAETCFGRGTKISPNGAAGVPTSAGKTFPPGLGPAAEISRQLPAMRGWGIRGLDGEGARSKSWGTGWDGGAGLEKGRGRGKHHGDQGKGTF